MDTAEHIDRLRAGAERFAELLAGAAVDAQWRTTVVTCPGWSIRDLAEHTGGLYRWTTRLVAESMVVENWRSQMDIAYPTTDDEVSPWFLEGIGPMIDAFTAAPPDRRVWVWGVDPHARFWARRMLQETVVHCTDLTLTLGLPTEIPSDVAVDGIDEFLTNLPATARWGARLDVLRADGERLVLRAIDTGDTWRLRFQPTGMWWDRGSDGANVTVSGSAAELLLWVQGRQVATVEITGQTELADRYLAVLSF